MKWVFMVIMLMPFWLYLSTSNHDEALQSKLKSELKEGLKIATHDAALQLDREQLEQGKVVFIEAAAEETFRNSLQRTFKLNANLQPLPNSIWQSQFKIVLLDKVEQGPFPKIYNSGAPYYYMDVLNGPSIITIVKVKHPRFYGISKDFEYVVGSSHEYVP